MQKPQPSARLRLAAIGGLVAVLGGLLGVLLSSQAPEAESPASSLEPRPLSTAVHAQVEAPLERAADGIAIMPLDPSTAPQDEPLHPHPHTAIHDRIYRENNLAGQLSGAMDVKDVPGMRRLLQAYRDEYPEDAHRLQEGYALIADCLEHPTEATRSAGERYWQEHRSSMLRRYVRRHCLATP